MVMTWGWVNQWNRISRFEWTIPLRKKISVGGLCGLEEITEIEISFVGFLHALIFSSTCLWVSVLCFCLKWRGKCKIYHFRFFESRTRTASPCMWRLHRDMKVKPLSRLSSERGGKTYTEKLITKSVMVWCSWGGEVIYVENKVLMLVFSLPSGDSLMAISVRLSA